MAVERAVVSYGEQVEILATMDVGKMWDRYLGEFLAEWERLNRTGMAADGLERAMQAFLDDLSGKPLEDIARQSSTVAYNAGRSNEILRQFDQGAVKYVVRSEILDSNTCEFCANIDMDPIAIDSPDYLANMPPAGCYGGDRCRGFYVMIAGGES